ncbi:hypothetical protein C7457_0861 [Thermovibrio guaymasensis]|uniref:Uncharacterized protein n=1 Tax=Thermovibrio guaymasensis TaxID=240167 RepID=A0A420W9M2_9BACT|nr:hypothetical protein [Thermovibrio guaymasensis]RKQ63972.1 hypothetical protein C7457_0861 [Thermovibrio guaymasensis]
MAVIYGRVEGPEDIRRINCIIRDEMLEVETPEQLTDLKKRSDYLCTLTYSPFWRKKFGSIVEELREVACEENRVTVRLANYVARYKGWDKEYRPWGSDNLTIEERLKEIPEKVMKEILESVVDLKLSPEILEELRRNFCEIRKAMVLADSEETLERLKKQGDLIVAITKLSDFRERFSDILDKIDELVEREEKRNVKLANIVAEVKGWKVEFEVWTENEVREDETIEQYVQRLLEEEEKAERYIPTEAKYKEGKVLWLVYFHKGRNRHYAKRLYFPGSAKDIEIEGPGEFENKFGRKVWGVRIKYRARVAPATIRIGKRVLHLPERWVERVKVVPLPKEAAEVKLVEERPEFAYPVA